MAKRAKKVKKKQHTKPQRRRYYIFPYVIMALLIIGIPFGIYELYVSNVDRTVRDLTEAIKTYDIEYLEANTDRLPIILDVYRKSYSDDSEKEDDFYKNSMANLEVNVLESDRKSKGKEVKVSVSNVNYIDVYEKVPETDNDDEIHDYYMAALGDPNQEKNTREAILYLERNLKGYKINESRDFINAILGGALEYAEGGQKLEESSIDAMDDAMNDND